MDKKYEKMIYTNEVTTQPWAESLLTHVLHKCLFLEGLEGLLVNKDLV